MGQSNSLQGLSCPDGQPVIDVMLKAAKDGDLERLNLIIKSHDSIVNARNKRRNTPLHIASIHGRTDVARVLLEHGALVNTTCMHGYTPLYIAVMQNHVDLVEELLRHGADINISPTKDCTAMKVAEMQGSRDIARLLRHSATWAEPTATPTTISETLELESEISM